MTTPTPEQEKWVVDFAENCKSHEDWLIFIRFGLNTLLQNPALLHRLIENEAASLSIDDAPDTARHAYVGIMSELGLRFTVATTNGAE